VSFPEPLIECSTSLAETLRDIGSRIEEQDKPASRFSIGLKRPQTSEIWRGSHDPKPDAVASLIPLLEPVYKRPQGEMLQGLCGSLVPFFISGPRTSHGEVSEIFSELLTRKGVSVLGYLTLLC
jgi:hypothetical protein